MMLRKVSGTNIKGRTFSYDLGPATAIVGDNFAGKSSITDAIRLALMGHLPEVGKLPKATWELSSGADMAITVDFDNRAQLSRFFWLDGATVKTSVTGKGEMDGFESIPLLNAEAYFGMTDSHRTAYVFERIKLPDTYNALAIISECKRLNFGDDHSDQVERALDEVVDIVKAQFVPGGNVQEALAESIEELRESFTYWNTRAKSTQGAVTTLAELKLRSQQATMAAQGVDAHLQMKQGELDRLNTEHGKLQAQQQEAERTARRKNEVRKELDADRYDYPRSIAKAREQIRVASERVRDVKDPAGMRTELEKAASTLADIEAGMTKNQEVIDKAKKRLSELSGMKCCPWCKSKGKGWQANLEAELHDTIKPAEAANEEGERIVVGLRAVTATMRSAIASNDAAIQANHEARDDIRHHEAQIAQLLKDQAREEARRAELSAELDGLNVLPEEKDLTVAIEQHAIAIRDTRQAISEMQDKKDAETRLQQELKLAAQSELEHQDAAAHVTVIKAIAKLLKQKREDMITEAFTGLLKIANKVAGGILKSPLDLHENTVGRWEGSKFIPHRVFSGTERALCYIAIAVALSSTAPLKLVILDEFGRLDEENQHKVALRLLCLVEEGTIDQFIIVGTSAPTDTVDGLEIIKV